jgi:hypothetical protein
MLADLSSAQSRVVDLDYASQTGETGFINEKQLLAKLPISRRTSAWGKPN